MRKTASIFFFACMFFLFVGMAEHNAGHCAKRISGVFGYKFGQKIDISQIKDVQYSPGGFLYFYQNPPESETIFAKYKIRLTPKSHKVLDISAAEIFFERQEAEEKLNELNARMQKFGKAKKKELYKNTMYTIKKPKQKIVYFLRFDILKGYYLLFFNAMDLGLHKKHQKQVKKNILKAK